MLRDCCSDNVKAAAIIGGAIISRSRFTFPRCVARSFRNQGQAGSDNERRSPDLFRG